MADETPRGQEGTFKVEIGAPQVPDEVQAGDVKLTPGSGHETSDAEEAANVAEKAARAGGRAISITRTDKEEVREEETPEYAKAQADAYAKAFEASAAEESGTKKTAAKSSGSS